MFLFWPNSFVIRVRSMWTRHPRFDFGTAIPNFTVATLLRDISVNLHNREFATKLTDIGKELVSASPGIAAIWEDVHLSSWLLNHCWPPRWWFFDPRSLHDDVGASPRPELWNDVNTRAWGQLLPWRYGYLELWMEHITPAMNDIVLAHALRQLAALTSSEKASNAIQQTGEAIVRSASARLFDEYCGTPVRHPGPAPKSQAIPA